MAKKEKLEKEEEKASEKPAEEKPKKKHEQTKPPEKKPEKFKREARSIVRIAGKDLNGDYELARALTGVKGIGFALANSITRKASEELSIDRTAKLGSLNEEQIKLLTNIVMSPEKHGIPRYMLNRRKDRETGKDLHLTGHDLDFKANEDIGLEKKIASYKGIRHQLGLTVRGQRTRTSGRKGATVGVQKSARMKKAQKR